MSERGRLRRLLPALIVSVGLLALIVGVTGLRPERVAGTLRALHPGWCALAFVAYAGSYVGRGLRLSVLLPGATSVVHLTSVSARHTFFAVTLPFRTGEAVLPLLLAAEAGRPLPEGVSALGVMRLLDLLAVAVFLLAGLAFLPDAAPADMGWRALLVLAALIAGLLLLRPICARLGVLAQAEGRVRVFIGRAAIHVAALRAGQLLLAVLASLATWLCTYLACFLVLRAMAGAPAIGPGLADIGLARSLVGTTGLHLSAVIPISPVAGVGTWEAGWTAGYALVGLDLGIAATTAVVSHVVVFAFIAVIGGLGHLGRHLGRPAAPGSHPGSPSGGHPSD